MVEMGLIAYKLGKYNDKNKPGAAGLRNGPDTAIPLRFFIRAARSRGLQVLSPRGFPLRRSGQSPQSPVRISFIRSAPMKLRWKSTCLPSLSRIR